MTDIAIDEVTTSADRPEYQARMVANAANEPGWFKYLNAYKFRQDRGGHCTKVSRSPDPFSDPDAKSIRFKFFLTTNSAWSSFG